MKRKGLKVTLKEPRPLNQLMEQYGVLCAKAGDMEFAKQVAQQGLDQLYPQLFELRREIDAAKAAEAK